MISKLKAFSLFAADLQKLAGERDIQAIAAFGVQKLKPVLGFESAWYGWSRFEPGRTVVPASATVNLPGGFAKFWSTIESQDLVARAFREKRTLIGTYDRTQPAQTDGMIALCERYHLRKWASAMHHNRRSRTAFFVSIYRGDTRSRDWQPDELELLQCAVDHISLAMEVSTRHACGTLGEQMLVVDAEGGLHIANSESQAFLRGVWPGWRGEQLPKSLLRYVREPGTFYIKGRGVVLSSSRVTLENSHLVALRLRETAKSDRLSPREAQVARALAAGATYKQAAAALGSAPATIRNQTQAIYTKLGIASRAQLATLLSKEG